MRTIYIVDACDENLGEAQGVFDEKGKLISAWSCNDANWRDEYFNGFMKTLGITVKSRKTTASDIAKLKDHFGL